MVRNQLRVYGATEPVDLLLGVKESNCLGDDGRAGRRGKAEKMLNAISLGSDLTMVDKAEA